MSLKLKVRIAQVGIFCRKTAKLARKAHAEAQKLALAVVIVEFIIAGGFYWIIKENLVIPQIVQIAPVEAKTVQHNEAQAPQKEEAKPSIDENKDIADKIYRLESSSGKNDQKCERIGKHNGYGYAQGVGKNFCLNSDNEVRALVVDWIKDKQAQGMTEPEMLSLYSGGAYR